MTQPNFEDDFENDIEDDGVVGFYEEISNIDPDQFSTDEITEMANKKLFADIDKYLDE